MIHAAQHWTVPNTAVYVVVPVLANSSPAVKYNELLTVLWDKIDPTTLNRQGNDSGTQYRSG